MRRQNNAEVIKTNGLRVKDNKSNDVKTVHLKIGFFKLNQLKGPEPIFTT